MAVIRSWPAVVWIVAGDSVRTARVGEMLMGAFMGTL
jgi:hypothetical protein